MATLKAHEQPIKCNAIKSLGNVREKWPNRTLESKFNDQPPVNTQAALKN